MRWKDFLGKGRTGLIRRQRERAEGSSFCICSERSETNAFWKERDG